MDLHNEEFRRLMVSAKWRQARTARELGLTTGTVSRYWNGLARPSLPVLRLFAEKLGEALLLPGEPERPGGLSDGSRFLEKWESDIILILRRVDRPQREQAITAVRSLIDALTPRLRNPPALQDQKVKPSGDIAAELERRIAAVEALLSSTAPPASEEVSHSAQAGGLNDGTDRETNRRDRVESQPERIADGVGQKRSHPRTKKT